MVVGGHPYQEFALPDLQGSLVSIFPDSCVSALTFAIQVVVGAGDALGGRGLFFGGSRAGRIRKEAYDTIWAIQKVCFYVRSILVSTFGGMLHTLLSHLGCTQPPIHAGKSMLCVAELPLGVEGVFFGEHAIPADMVGVFMGFE